MRNPALVLATLVFAAACSHDASRTVTTSSASSTSTASSSTGGELALSPSTAPAGNVVSACGEAQVFFTTASSELDGGARARLNTYAGCLSRQEIDTIYVSGMTDPDGDAAANVVLGRARAQSVADYLRGLGCAVEFVIRSYGETEALEAAPLWPIERSASATGVATP